MPRQVKKRLKGQKQVRDQETFDFSTPARRGAARPVDPMVQQYPDSKAKNVMDFVTNMQGAMRAGVAVSGVIETEQRKKGKHSAQRGEDTPEGKHWAFMEGYEGFKGDVGVSEYLAEIDDLYSKSGELEDTEWDAARDDIGKKHLEGRSDAYLDSFMPKALKIDSKYDQKFHTNLRERVSNDYLSGTKKIASSTMITLYNDTEMSGEERAQGMRDMLSTQQAKANFLGMANKSDVSAQFLNHAMNMAKRDGRPDYLDFASIPDKDNFRLIDRPEYADEIEKAKTAAENTATAMESAALTKRKAAHKKVGDDIQKAIHKAIAAGDMTGARDAVLAYEPYIPAAPFGKLLKEVNLGFDETSFAKYTDADAQRYLFGLATQGALTPEHFSKYRQMVTKDEYMSLGEVNSRAIESATKSGTTVPKYLKVAAEYKKSLRTLVVGNDLVNMLKLPEKKKMARATHLFNMAVDAEHALNGSKNLNNEWFWKTINSIAKGIVGSDATGTNDPASTKSGGNVGRKLDPNALNIYQGSEQPITK